jgi:hypothetical protein
MNEIRVAKHRLSRALENLARYERGTYGHRDAVWTDIPGAVEAMIEAVLAERERAKPLDLPVFLREGES